MKSTIYLFLILICIFLNPQILFFRFLVVFFDPPPHDVALKGLPANFGGKGARLIFMVDLLCGFDLALGSSILFKAGHTHFVPSQRVIPGVA